jgi:hypothetical protein
MFLLLKLVKPAILVAALVLAYLYAPPLGGVSGKAVHANVVRELGGTTATLSRSCRRRSPTLWRCGIYAKGASDPVSYAVRMRGRRCWTGRQAAQQATYADRLPRQASGCVGLRDQLPRF